MKTIAHVRLTVFFVRLRLRIEWQISASLFPVDGFMMGTADVALALRPSSCTTWPRRPKRRKASMIALPHLFSLQISKKYPATIYGTLGVLPTTSLDKDTVKIHS